jgi:hypothetical protein
LDRNIYFFLFRDYKYTNFVHIQCICKHTSKDHRTMKTFLTSWTTESVDGHSDYYRASAKTWQGPNSSSETHCVVRHSWYYFQYSRCLINYPINIRQIYNECLLIWMSVHIWLDISCLSSVCQGCCTCNPEIYISCLSSVCQGCCACNPEIDISCLSSVCQGCCTCNPQIGHFMYLKCLSRLLYM